ncbi:MAG TPA: solute carrier family 23 protein [Pseudonocardiaceae bacterium]|nr:solute carrier family 23 protein [Pseudonocardiaceae bacterium]
MALWTVHGDGRRLGNDEVVRSDERLSWPLTVGLGLQHVVAMAGATILVPTLTGFPVSTTLLFSGVGTLLFLLITRNRVPSYLGASYAFVAPLVAAHNEGLAAQFGGVLFAGILLAVVGVAVKALGIRLVDSVMPPIVTGAVIVLIGLNLAPVAGREVSSGPWPAGITLVVIGLCAVLSKGLLVRLGVLAGVVVGWVVAALSGGLDAGRVAALGAAPWLGMPALHEPQLRPSVMLAVLPAVAVLTAQSVAYTKAVGGVIGRDLAGNVGDALIANGLATALSGAGGGAGLTPLGENVGVMAATKVYSTATCLAAALGAVVLSFSPKVAALVETLPAGVIGGMSIVLFGMVVMVGVRLWLDNDVNLADPLNLMVVGTAIVAGAGNVIVNVSWLRLNGIVVGSLLIVLGYPLLRTLRAIRQRRAALLADRPTDRPHQPRSRVDEAGVELD